MERELDVQESNFVRYDQLDTGRVCYVFFVNSNEQITKQRLENAMTMLVRRHALLRMCVRNMNGKLHWKQIDDLQIDIQVDYTEDWNLQFSHAVGTGFDIEKGPLWNMKLLPNVDSEFFDDAFEFHAALLFRFQHAIIDGMGKIIITLVYKCVR